MSASIEGLLWVVVQCMDFSANTQSSVFNSMLEINAAPQSTGQMAIEAELTSVDCGATKLTFHEPQKTELL